MVCKVCGRTAANEDANFCDYCGASFREMNAGQQDMVQNTAVSEPVQVKAEEKKDKPVSMLNWLGTLALPFIPYIGWIAYLVLLFVWSFGSDTNPTKKNWARAMLIVSAVVLVIVVAFIGALYSDFVSSGLSIQDYVSQMSTY